MNIVFDDGLMLDSEYRKTLAPLLPIENAPLKLNSCTSKTDGTLCADEGVVFITHLPVDVLRYHSEFFDNYKNSPQWFFVLVNKNDHGITDLRNAARKHNLKNYTLFHAGNIETFQAAIKEISNTRHIIKGKVLFLSKHKRDWTLNLAKLLFYDESKYEIMDSANMKESDSETLLLCGERMTDFKGFTLPYNMEPYFIFKFREELQYYIDPSGFINGLAEYYHMTTERVESRLYFVDVESEMWLAKKFKTTGEGAISDGILLWDRFGLPVSRKEYTEINIKAGAQKHHENIERLRKIM